MPPVKPMLAKAIYEVPRTGGLLYEPKWDGFRCLVFRDGDEVELWSRTDRPLNRYFPEMVRRAAGRAARALRGRRRAGGRHRATASTSTRCSCGSTPPSRG